MKTLKNAKHVQKEHFDFVMSKLSEQENYKELNDMKSMIADKKMVASVDTYNSLFSTLFSEISESGCDNAIDLWKEMKSNDVKPNETSYNLFIGGLASSSKRYSSKALDELLQMVDNGINPSSELCYKVFLPLLERRDIQGAESLVEFMKKSSSPDTRLYNLLLRLYIEENDQEKIDETIKQMDTAKIKRDSKTWALLMESATNNPDIASNLIKEMKDKSIKSDEIIASAMVGYHLSLNDPETAENELNSILENGQTPHTFAYTNLLSHYAKKGDIKRAERVFNLMKERNITITREHYHLLGTGYIEKAMFNEWDGIQREMAENNLSPSLDTYHIQMQRLMYDNESTIGAAESVLEIMRKKGIKPTLDTWTLLLDGYCVVGDMEHAHKVLDKMRTAGVEPKSETLLSLITGYHLHGNIKDAAPLIHKFSAMEAKEFLSEHELKEQLQLAKE